MAGPARAVHRARRRLQPRADVARERRPQRRDDGPRRGARRARRLDAVLDFAELREFADLKLKNYSSGMMVRLAFAVMVEADADIMLVDEVLAVGDASFAQKCMDVFREKRSAGRTLVLVTHDMATVQGFCDRAMLIHDGELRYLGDPEEAALRYYRLNFGGRRGDGAAGAGRRARTSTCASSTRGSRTRSASGSRTSSRGSRSGSASCSRRATTSRRRSSASTSSTPTAMTVFGFNRTLTRDAGEADRSRPGERVRIAGHDREPAAARALLRQLLDLAQPHAGRPRAARGAAARLRRLRHAARARAASPCARTSRSRSSIRRARRRGDDATRVELREVRGPVGARRRLAALARPAAPDRRHRVQAHLPRDRARLPVVARAGRCCCSACCWPSSPRRSTSATA